jgi:uncharacterized BrkB/YihY/UPF0761 family membrane protein
LERTRLRAAAIQARAHQLSERAQAERGHHASLDAAFEMVDRDSELGGGMIAGALAYRLFIWLLPLALVAVAGLGIAADAASESPRQAAESLGVGGLVSNSIATAARGSARWYALLVGIPVLVWATRSVLRALIVAHRLLWTDVRAAAPRPTLLATVRLLALLLGFYAISGLASTARAWSPGPGVLVTLLAVLPYAGVWLLVTVRLPHRGVPWQALVPGALLFGVGIEALHVVIAYVITPLALSKQGTYGALGIAAGLLLALFLVSRLAVAAAVVNATLWDRRVGSAAS